MILLTWLYLFTGAQHLCTFNIVTPLFITFCQMFGKRSTPSARPSLLMFHIDLPIARISSSLVLYCTGFLAVVHSLWRRNCNRMDSYRVSKVDVPESAIASGARGPWQQQRCDSLHYHEGWWGSVPPSVVVFSYEGPDTTQEMNLSVLYGGQYETSTNMDVLMVYDAFQAFGKRW